MWSTIFSLKWIKFKGSGSEVLKQLHFSCNGHIVDFRNAKRDYINVRTQLLGLHAVYYINVYVISKNDEMCFGILAKDAYDITKWPDYCEGAIQYTNSGRIDVNDNNVTRVRGFGTGDWITVHIDFPGKQIVFYRNGMRQSALDSEHFLDGECYFWTFVDRPQDALFIECAPTLCFAEDNNGLNSMISSNSPDPRVKVQESNEKEGDNEHFRKLFDAIST